MRLSYALPALLAAFAAPAAQAHFGMIIPSDPMLALEEGERVTLEVSFSHPFDGEGMDLVAPEAFGVTHDGATTDLRAALAPATIMGHAGFRVEHAPKAPGAYAFHMTPRPYWEPAEDAFIVHYTKTYVSAFGDDSGWDAEIGLPTEIVPLAKPFAQWAGNVFQGIVKAKGAPVPFAEVEVEHYAAGAVAAPSDLMVTQTIRADGNGVFTYAAPAPGWWGFAALGAADYTLPHDGAEKPVELGAVLWVRFEPWPGR